MVRLGTQGTDADHKGGGGGVDQKGDYHFLIEKFDDFSQAENPSLKFQFLVIGGANADQIGRKHTETFFLQGRDEKGTVSAQNRVLEFACAIGIYNKQQWRADIEAGQPADLPFESAELRQFCAPIEMRPYNGKDPEKKKQHEGRLFANLGFKFWAIGDQEADHIPKDPDYLSMFGPPGSPLPTKEGPPRVPNTATTAQAGPNGIGTGHKAPPVTPASQKAVTPPATPPAAVGFGGNF